jgi:hypothetical protein
MIDLPFRASTIKRLTLSGAVGAHADNLFLVSTPVEISGLFGVVETVLADNLTGAFFDLWDGAISVPLSLNNTVISLLPEKSLLVKQDVAATNLVAQSSATGALVELVAGLPPRQSCIVVPKSATATYVRFRHDSAGATSGVIRFAIEYRSLGSGGVSPA